jgi:hypothetical protein
VDVADGVGAHERVGHAVDGRARRHLGVVADRDAELEAGLVGEHVDVDRRDAAELDRVVAVGEGGVVRLGPELVARAVVDAERHLHDALDRLVGEIVEAPLVREEARHVGRGQAREREASAERGDREKLRDRLLEVHLGFHCTLPLAPMSPPCRR